MINNKGEDIVDDVEVAKKRLEAKIGGSILFSKEKVENEKKNDDNNHESTKKEIKLN